MMRRSHQVTANVEKVADESVHGQESLCLTGRFEPSHVSLALPCGLVGDFGAIVLVSVRAMGDRRGVVARIVTGPHEANRQDPHLPMRYDAGRPRAVIRFRISQPRTASLPCPAGLRARRPAPMMDL